MNFTNQDYQALKTRYEAAGQGHVFTFFNELTSEQQEKFYDQLASIQVEHVSRIAQDILSKDQKTQDSAKVDLKPLPAHAIDFLDSASPEKLESWRELGFQLIGQNKVAAILMAGGQGTRLGSSAPKGCYDIGLPSHKCLFQLQAERILRLQTLARTNTNQNPIIPWYIMTSGPTHHPTCEFFESNDFFGLDRSNVIFFEQGVVPCFTLEGKLMLERKDKLAIAPDGNGGLYDALYKQGIIDSLKERGVEYSHCYSVDNSLVRVADPVFVGHSASRQTDCGIKVVPKSHPEEPVGVICLRNNKYGVVEYSEISDSLAHQRNSDSTLAFGSANIVNHLFSTGFLESAPTFADQLEYHVANKKIPFVDLSSGETIKPTAVNGIKLERFVFDVFGHAKAFSALQVDRSSEFSPVKNGPGAGSDCPETARRDILKLHARYIEKAGGVVNSDVEVELSPLLSYSGEGLGVFEKKAVNKSGNIHTLEDLSVCL
ncbi:UDP-N-acetylglucosamine diphosphorylase [Phycomyces nitens]|nr:UDP-N-acetylglucosamine diphosphorylase [Phycomyces nitens]